MATQQQRYRVLEKIASGGMAEVFRAESAGLEGFKKTVAIKRVLPHLSQKKQFMGMFLDEARLSAHLSHSNCVQVFDIGVGDNTYFIVMEYVDGADLKAIVEYRKKQGQLFPLEEACLICVRICEGLAYAHELTDAKGQHVGIVHRDMSPPNVLITRFGEVKIVDFGLAKANSQLEHSEPGIIKGKFSYLSPEAALGQPVDARTDIFAVGIILWELLAGRRLFMGETDLETVRQVQSARVPPLSQFNPQVPPELEQLLARALARDPAMRYQSARQLGADLNALMFQFQHPVSSFDIAGLLEPVISERDSSRRRKAAQKSSIIGSLIEEALFEFSSLDSSGDSSPSGGETPLNLGSFGGAQDWSKDLGIELGGRAAAPEQQYELGSLASLEDDSPSARRQSAAPPAIDAPVEPAPPPASAPRNSGPGSAPMPPPASQKSSGGGRGVIFLLLLLVLVAGAAGAYFGGLLPKDFLPH